MVNWNGFPVLLAACLFIVSTTVLTWCFGMQARTVVPETDFSFRVAVRTSAVVSWRTLPYPRWRMAGCIWGGLLTYSCYTCVCGLVFLCLFDFDITDWGWIVE